MLAFLWLGLALVVSPPADWPDSSPSSERMDAAKLAEMDAYIRAQLPHVRSLLIARHGSLVFERYYADASRDGLQNLQSMTKSVSSALVGIALKKHLIASLDAMVLDYLPEYRDAITDPRVEGITIRNLLTMSTGIDEMQLSFDKALSDPIRDILRQRLIFAPGQGFKYSSPAAHLLGGVLRKATGKAPLEFAESELFGPVGMGHVVWYADRSGLQSGGLSGLFRARDMMKFGQLYLQRGRWTGAELIPTAYVADSVKVQNRGEFYGEPARYGYMWWIATICGEDGFYARGFGGQYLMVLPRFELVILCTSDWRQPEYPQHFALIEKFILPAVAAN
jgi:CubicO group peptidase (beta-lactamase class C family)